MILSALRKHRNVPGRPGSDGDEAVLPVEETAASAQPCGGADVAVVGLSGRYGKAEDVHELWEMLKSAGNGVSEVPACRWDWRDHFSEAKEPGKSYTRWACFLTDIDCFDAKFFRISPRDAELMDPQSRIFLEEAYKAIEDAGYTPSGLADGRRVGVFVGVTNCYYGDSPSYWAIANRVSHHFDFRGPSLAVDAACSSSLAALHLAVDSLQTGSSDLALVGGVNLFPDPAHFIRLSAMRMVSPGSRCSPYGAGADGFLDGEGVGAVILKPLAAAMAAGDHIYGVIKGTMINAGGRTDGFTVPNPEAQAHVVAGALERAGVDARTISYIEGHGTGTVLGDPIEVLGLTEAFQRQTDGTQFCALGSVKSNIGHCESAAGIAGLTKVLLQLQHRQLAPTLNAAEANPHIDFAQGPFFLQTRLSDWRRPRIEADGGPAECPRRAGISSFGAGGANAHVIVEEYDPPGAVPAPQDHPCLIVLSARTPEALRGRAARLLEAIARGQVDDSNLADMAYTLQVGREPMEERLAFATRAVREASAALEAFLNEGTSPTRLFSGQSRRHAGTLAALSGDEMIQEAVLRWAKTGQHDRLLQAWVGGFAIDWRRLHQGHSRRRLSLPTYPFARERFWAPGGRAAEAGQSTQPNGGPSHLHPLLHENVSSLDATRFRTRLAGTEFFLRDHVVQGRRVLPGAAQLEMARAAVARATTELPGRVVLHDVLWLRPLVVDEGGVDVEISLAADAAGFIRFEIARLGGSERTMIGRGRATCESGGAAPSIDLDRLRSQCPASREADLVYAGFEKAGLAYGPAHRPIRRLLSGDRLALAQLALPEGLEAGFDEFVLHPSLIDGALQTVAGLFESRGDDPPVLPFSVGRVETFGACPRKLWVRAAPSSAGDGADLVDVELYDESGRLVVRLSGLSLRPAGPRSAQASDVPVPAARERSAPAEPLAQPDRIWAAVTGLISELLKVSVDDIQGDAEWNEFGFDSITLPQLADRLQDMGVDISPNAFFELPTVNALVERIRRDGLKARGMEDQAAAEIDPTSAAAPAASLQASPAAGPQIEADAATRHLLLRPIWTAVEGERLPAPSKDERIAILGGASGQRDAVLQGHGQAWVLPADEDAFADALDARGPIDRIVWIVDDQPGAGAAASAKAGTLLGFRLIKALVALGYRDRKLTWTVVTRRAHSLAAAEPSAPAQAAVHGMMGAVAKEMLLWSVHLIDLGADDAFSPPLLLSPPAANRGESLALRGGLYHRQSLVPAAPHCGPSPYRQGGVYIVIGGAGGIGRAWTRSVVTRHGAKIVWFGRRSADAVQGTPGGQPGGGAEADYMQVDCRDPAALATACAAVRERFGEIHGVVHAAMVLHDRGIVHMSEDEFLECLSVKVEVAAAIDEALEAQPLDFVLIFSSLQSFVRSAGQSNYAAGCAYTDSFARSGRDRKWPVKVMNWGFWSGASSVGTPAHLERFSRLGIQPIEPAEGLAALDGLLGGSFDQLAFLATTRTDWPGPAGEADATSQSPATEPAAVATAAMREVSRLVSEVLDIPPDDVDPDLDWSDLGLARYDLQRLAGQIAANFRIDDGRGAEMVRANRSVRALARDLEASASHAPGDDAPATHADAVEGRLYAVTPTSSGRKSGGIGWLFFGNTQDDLLAAQMHSPPIEESNPVGLAGRVLSGDTPIPVALFYPALSKARPLQIGRFQLRVAIDGEPASRMKGLVVISHGFAGTELVHCNLAQALARSGYLVAAPLHPGDNWHDQSLADGPDYLAERPRHLAHLLDALLADESWGWRFPQANVGAIAHSLGAASVLSLLGARIDMSRAYSVPKGELDEATATLLEDGPFLAARDTPPAVRALAGAVLLAPVCSIFDAASVQAIDVPVRVYMAGSESVLNNRFHAGWLCEQLPQCECITVPHANHFAFVAPQTGATLFPDAPAVPPGRIGRALSQALHRDGRSDPEFDLAAFHQGLELEVAAFFDSRISSQPAVVELVE